MKSFKNKYVFKNTHTKTSNGFRIMYGFGIINPKPIKPKTTNPKIIKLRAESGTHADTILWAKDQLKNDY